MTTMHKVLTLSAVLLLAGGGLFVTLGRGGKPDPALVAQEREASYLAAKAASETDSSWPAAPEALIRAFWDAASRKDYDTLVRLCPGSRREDFAGHYDRFTPSPAKSIGQPQRHPDQPHITMYPVTVAYPGFPNKTVKMAVYSLSNDKPAIDGRFTIWW